MAVGILDATLDVEAASEVEARGLDEADKDGVRCLLRKLTELVRSQRATGIRRDQFDEILEAAGVVCSDAERKFILKLMCQMCPEPTGYINVDMWMTFCQQVEEDVLSNGPVNSKSQCAMEFIDFFPATTYSNFVKYTQVSWCGCISSIIGYVCFVLVILYGVKDFALDTKFTVREQMGKNTYGPAELARFMFFCRTSSYKSMMDPSVFNFEMSYYVKSISEEGQVVEEYSPVATQTVTKEGSPWWPQAVPDDVYAVAPGEEHVEIQGAYFLPHFKQLEVRLRACRNSTDARDTEATVCRPQEEIDAILQGLSVNMVDWSHDNGVPGSQYWVIMNGGTKQVDLWYGRQSVTVTAKWPTQADEVHEVMPLHQATEQLTPQWSDGTFAVFWFSQHAEMTYITTTRQDIIMLMSDLGGTWATLITVVGLLAYQYNKKRLSDHVPVLRRRSCQLEDLRAAAKQVLVQSTVV